MKTTKRVQHFGRSLRDVGHVKKEKILISKCIQNLLITASVSRELPKEDP